MPRPHTPLLALALVATAAAAEPTLDALPHGRLRDEVARLPAPQQEKALRLLAAHPGVRSDPAVRASITGELFYVCPALLRPVPARIAAGPPAAALVPISQPPALHSRAGSANIIYLDFNGMTVKGTAWNSEAGYARTSFTALAFDLDGDRTTFNDAEQTAIRRIWERVAEDYAPFEVDVTTVAPATFTRTCAHALITANRDGQGHINPYALDLATQNPLSGGVAYVDVFGHADYVANYSPAWIYYQNLGPREDYIAEAVSHEIGHNLGLHHDGLSGADGVPGTGDDVGYYTGHGSGLTSWAPIMGAGYDREFTQWSKGEYNGANNAGEDDLAVIAADLGYRPADHGASIAAAGPLHIQSGAIPGDDPANQGVIERSGVADVFSLSLGTGSADITVSPFASAADTLGGDLYLQAELLDSTGAVLASAVPDAAAMPLDAAVHLNHTIPADGDYYLRITGIGWGDPANDGFSAYASLGQYRITGTVPGTPGTISCSAAAIAVSEGDSGSSYATITVTRTGGSAGAVTVAVATSDGTATSAGLDYGPVSTSVGWTDGDQADKTVRIPILGDTTAEADETFTVVLSSPTAGANLGAIAATTVTILDDDPAPPAAGSLQFAAYSATVGEGSGSALVTIRRVGGSAGIVGVHLTSINGTATGGHDFTAISQNLSWADGDAGDQIVAIAVSDDAVPAADRSFAVALSAPSGGAITPTPARMTIVIQDDDDGATFSRSGISVPEPGSGTAQALLTVQRLGAAHGSLDVHYATGDLSAAAGTDYTATAGNLSWSDGDTAAKTISVTVAADAIAKNVRTFQVVLSSPTASGAGSAVLGSHPAATVSIVDPAASGAASGNGHAGGGGCGTGALALLGGAALILRLRRASGDGAPG